MGIEQGAGRDDKAFALGRQPHMAGGALQQAITQALFKALELEADGGLGGVEGFGGAGETGEIGDQHKRLHGVDIQGFGRIGHIKSLSHLYWVISC